MIVKFSAEFDLQFDRRLTNRQKIQVLDTLDLFVTDPFNGELRNHELGGKLSGIRSISIGGDLRLHYKVIDGDVVLFVAVGTHDQLYR
jgi:addiction module RelE/StbE family toxin